MRESQCIFCFDMNYCYSISENKFEKQIRNVSTQSKKKLLRKEKLKEC